MFLFTESKFRTKYPIAWYEIFASLTEELEKKFKIEFEEQCYCHMKICKISINTLWFLKTVEVLSLMTILHVKNLIHMLFLVFVIYNNTFYILISSCHPVSSKVMFEQKNGNKLRNDMYTPCNVFQNQSDVPAFIASIYCTANVSNLICSSVLCVF